MNARRVSVGTGEGAKEPAAACCERLVAYQAHGVQQEVLHHAVPRAGAVVARDEADGGARVLGEVDGRVGVARQKRRSRAAHLVVPVKRGGAQRHAERLEAFDGAGLIGAGSVRNLI